jgi:hypothetical protein
MQNPPGSVQSASTSPPFKDDEALTWVPHFTDNDRLGTTAIYLNLIDMHVVDQYTQKW